MVDTPFWKRLVTQKPNLSVVLYMPDVKIFWQLILLHFYFSRFKDFPVFFGVVHYCTKRNHYDDNNNNFSMFDYLDPAYVSIICIFKRCISHDVCILSVMELMMRRRRKKRKREKADNCHYNNNDNLYSTVTQSCGYKGAMYLMYLHYRFSNIFV